MNHFLAAKHFEIDAMDPGSTLGWSEEHCNRVLRENAEKIAVLQNRLYAESERSLLIVLQAMDTGGKDPIIRDVLSAANPQACRVTAFKKASKTEELQDRLARFHEGVPSKGEIGVFNRSYYDELIHDDAHREISSEELQRGYKCNRMFEELLSDDHVRLVKIYLHMSKDEQKHRLQERMDDPTRHWELSEADFQERKHWDGYMRAYERAIRESNTDFAPWYVIPSDHKWFRDAAASTIVAEVLEDMDPQFPPASFDLSTVELD